MDVPNISNSPPAQTNAFAALDTGEFVKILISELQNQDPFNPQDTTALLEQLSSLRNIESQTNLNEQLKDLVTQNQVAAAGNLIGKLVQGIDSLNSQTSGLVTSVRVTRDGVFLELDNGRSMSIGQVTAIAEMPATTAQALASA
jgi:flagellar basal-body rod modification protein FlgD